MAEKESTVKPEKKPADTKAKYDITSLREYSLKVLHVTTSTFDGAFFGKGGMYSIDEAEAILNDWLDKEVK